MTSWQGRPSLWALAWDFKSFQPVQHRYFMDFNYTDYYEYVPWILLLGYRSFAFDSNRKDLQPQFNKNKTKQKQLLKIK